MNKVPDNAILITVDVVGIYLSIAHNEDQEILKKQLDSFDVKLIPTEDLVKMAEFVLKNKYLGFNSKLKHKPSWAAIGTKFALPYACIYGLHGESISHKLANWTLDLVQVHWHYIFLLDS